MQSSQSIVKRYRSEPKIDDFFNSTILVEWLNNESASELVIGVDLLVESKHLESGLDAEVLNAHWLASQEVGKELFGEALCVLTVYFVKLVALFSAWKGFLLGEVHFY